MKDIKSIVSGNLSALRKQRGITQAELAEKLNYSDKSISNITPQILEDYICKKVNDGNCMVNTVTTQVVRITESVGNINGRTM